MQCLKALCSKQSFMDPVGGKLHASLDLYPGPRGRSVVFGKFRLPALIMRIV